MSVKAVAVSAALTVGLLVPVSAAMAADGAPATTAAKTPSIAKQLKSLKTQVKKNTATGKANTAKIKAASKAVATTVAGLNAKADAINKRVDAGDKATSNLDGKVNTVIATATDALTKLQAGLVQVGDGLKSLAASYTNFEYGVVQVYIGTTAMPGAFLATPRLDPTVEQSTVTGQFPCLPTAGYGGVCNTGSALHLKVAVRSANPTANDATSKVYCRVTGSQGTSFVTSKPNTAFPGAVSPNFPPAYRVTRSPLVPTDPAELAAGAFPLSPATSDTFVDLTDGATNASALNGAAPGATANVTSLNGMINVTLSCLTVPNPAT